MCGIAGIYNIDTPIDNILLKQTHRGPDSKDINAIDLNGGLNLQLGHNRLKVICLSDNANQPFVDRSNNHFLVFNGEIYNYQSLRQELKSFGIIFRTDSDTEILLESLKYWGMNALNKLNGMFAFAYFNRESQALYLARDRFGVKPLFYYASKDQLMFASTSSPIADIFNLKPNYNYLNKGLHYGIFDDNTSQTAYDGLHSVKPGHYIKFNLSGHLKYNEIQYYDFSLRVKSLEDEISNDNQSVLSEKVLATLNDSCILRLNADVPLAVALSGGLDSSVIASLSNQHTSELNAFCFGDPKDKATEAFLAEKLSTRHNINTNYVTPSHGDWKDAFWETRKHQDAPFAGLSVVAQYLLYKNIKKQGIKVVLGGQGGDEAFLGYRKFQLFYLRELIEKKHWLQASGFFYYFSQMLYAERSRLPMFWKLRNRYSNDVSHRGLLNLPEGEFSLDMGYSSHIQNRQIDDVLKYSLPTLLRYEDRNSMAHSIESRLPFMDYQLMELATSLPVSMKLHKGFGKWVIRDIMKKEIPKEICFARYKRGFDVAHSQNVYELLFPSLKANFSAKRDVYREFLNNVKLEDYFSPVNLSKNPKAFTELSVLLWLGDHA